MGIWDGRHRMREKDGDGGQEQRIMNERGQYRTREWNKDMTDRDGDGQNQ